MLTIINLFSTERTVTYAAIHIKRISYEIKKSNAYWEEVSSEDVKDIDADYNKNYEFLSNVKM